jgi:uncharacterized protein (DUF302 family)
MKTAVSMIIGLLVGIILTGLIVWNMMPSMMLNEKVSPLNLDDTVNKIMENATAIGWNASRKDLYKSIEKHGGGVVKPVVLVDLCQAQHASKILNDDDARIVSVMMPCTVSVYVKEDGKAYVGFMNAGLLGKAFGGVVATVMGGDVAADQKKFLTFLN